MRQNKFTALASSASAPYERRRTALRDLIAGGFLFQPAQAATYNENRAHEAGPL